MGKPTSPVAPEQVVADQEALEALLDASMCALTDVTVATPESQAIWNNAHDVISARRLHAASPEAAPAAMEGANVPDGWCIDREPRNVLALYRTGTAQPYRFEPGDAVHALLSDMIGGCPECGGRMEYEDGEPWDGPSVGCVECGAIASPTAATPAAPSAVTDELVVAAREAVRWLNSWFRNHDGNKIAEALSAALARPAPVQAGAQQAVERYCNKCGYFGPDELHFRPNGTGECGYFSMPTTAPTQAGAGDAKGGA